MLNLPAGDHRRPDYLARHPRAKLLPSLDEAEARRWTDTIQARVVQGVLREEGYRA